MIVSKGQKVRRFLVILALTVCFGTPVYFLTGSAVTAQDLVVNRKAEGISLDPAKTTTMED